MTLHPALLDELVQTAGALWLAHYVTSPGPVVVAGFDEVRAHGSRATHTRLASVRLWVVTRTNVAADLFGLALPTTKIQWRDGQRAIARVRQGADIDVPIPAASAPVVRPGTADGVAAATAGGLALRGIVHAAGWSRTRRSATSTINLLARIWCGKADRAWALHQTIRAPDLDFFNTPQLIGHVQFRSMSTRSLFVLT